MLVFLHARPIEVDIGTPPEETTRPDSHTSGENT